MYKFLITSYDLKNKNLINLYKLVNKFLIILYSYKNKNIKIKNITFNIDSLILYKMPTRLSVLYRLFQNPDNGVCQKNLIKK